MPLIFRLPDRVAQGKVCRQPATVVDLAPTFFHLAGVPLPWTMHGHDLMPLLKDPQGPWDQPVIMEHFQWQFGEQTDAALTGDRHVGGVPWWIFLRQGKYKYIRTLVPDEVEELYDLEQDPEELTNLAIDANHRELLKDLRERLLAELRHTGAGLVDNLPAPRVAEQSK